MQLENADEQAAAIRRELDARSEKISEMEKVRINILFRILMWIDEKRVGDITNRHLWILQNRKLMPKFVLKEMESLYIEELTGSISTLKSNLESLPVQQGKTKDSKFPPLKINKLNKK